MPYYRHWPLHKSWLELLATIATMSGPISVIILADPVAALLSAAATRADAVYEDYEQADDNNAVAGMANELLLSWFRDVQNDQNAVRLPADALAVQRGENTRWTSLPVLVFFGLAMILLPMILDPRIGYLPTAAAAALMLWRVAPA